MALAAGTNLGPYHILAPLGAGGMGEVYKASDTRLNRLVAIKLSQARFSDRFEREARAIAALNHPNICTLHDVGPNYLVMEYIEGQPLTPPLPVDGAVKHAIEVADALEAAHARGIVHRDIKPSNILITARDEAKVLDFGLARQADAVESPGSKALTQEMLTEPGTAIGTTPYMSPEQVRGQVVDGRTDLWALGVVLYQAVTGTRPFDGATPGMILESVLTQTPLPARERNPHVAPELERIIGKCLEKDLNRRYQTASEVLADLRNLQLAGPRATTRKPVWAMVASALVGIGLAVAAYWYWHRPPKLTEKDTIVLADFDNKTGDPVFDDTLRQGLSVELQQSPFLNIVSDAQVQRTLTLMGQPKQARLTPEVAQQICERTGSAAGLEGSIASLGSQYVLGLRAKNCGTGNILDREQTVASKREDVLNSLSHIASNLRTRVGESLATVEKHSTPLAEATTTSLEALKAYSTGQKVVVISGNGPAMPWFRRAVEIDPKFAMAQALLGLQYSGMGESVLSVESTTNAYLLRDRVSDRERFFIDFLYDRDVTGNLEKAYETLENWYQIYPRGENPNAQGFLAALATQGTGRFERAIEMSERRIAASPEEVFGYGNLASAYIFLDRFPEAESALRRAAERMLGNPNQMVMPYILAVLKGDKERMDREEALAKGKRGAEYRLAHEEALALARSGRLQAARRSSGRAMDLALQQGDREVAASYQAARAVWEAVYGNGAEAKRNATAALKLSKSRDVEYAAGLALAFSGDSSRSDALAGNLEKRFPEDTFAKFTYVPVLRALAALDHGKPAESVEVLQIALRYELAANGLNMNHWYLGGLHSAYARGEALIAEHRYAEAAGEFQKVLNHRGIVGLDPIGALAHLHLGRVFALSGDKTKAKSAYEDFFTLWKDADPEILILKQAKAEYAKIQ